MKFEKDVFISYAHLDDKPLDEGAKGWITDFHRLLETRLEQTIGYDINVWRDERLTGNEEFATGIDTELIALKVLVSIITPRYLDSPWCKRELVSFYESAARNGGVTVGSKSRIFKIVKTPVDKNVIENLPEGIHKIFDEILDYKFYIQDPGTGKFKELNRSSWENNSIKQEYMNKLDDVVQDMANLIKELNSNSKTDPAKQKIYLAETSFDMQVYHDNLARELQEANFMVLPDKNLPLVADKFTAEVESYLDQSILSLHIVSPTNYSVQPEGVDKSTVILQNEIAAKKSKTNNLNRLIWIPPSGVNALTNEKAIEHQKSFLNELKTNAETQMGADIVEGPLEEFKQAIFESIKRIAAEEKAKEDEIRNAEEKAKKIISGPVVTVSPKQGPAMVYLICDQRDLDETRPLEDFLSSNGNEILLPLFEGNQAQLRQAHLDNLKVCDAVIIYYGAGNYRWTGSMKSDLMRLPALGRTKPLSARTIFIAGATDKDKETFKANDIEIINGLNGFNTDLFIDFIQKLK